MTSLSFETGALRWRDNERWILAPAMTLPRVQYIERIQVEYFSAKESVNYRNRQFREHVCNR